MRIVRVTSPGAVHHVICRFLEKRHFLTTQGEREQYLGYLSRALTKTDWRCLAYALMSSHIHLAMLAGKGRAEDWLRRVNPPFVAWFNKCHDRIGPIVVGPPKMWITRAERVGKLIAYIHNNPVRAGVVERASDSAWTSHRAYIGDAIAPWLAVDEGLRLTGTARPEFDAFVHAERHERAVDPELEKLRRAARQRGALELAAPTPEPVNVELVARPFAWLRPDPREIIDVTSVVLGVPMERIRLRRAPEAVAARSVVVRVGRAFGVAMSSTGAALGISAQAASRLASRNIDAGTQAAMKVVYGRIEVAMREVQKEKATSVKSAR